MSAKNNVPMGYIRCQGILYEFPLKADHFRTDRKKHGAADGRPVFKAHVAQKESKK